MEEDNFIEMIQDAIEMYDEDEEVKNVQTFEEVGMLTMNKGIVVMMKDKSEFQITIVRSER